MVYYSYGGGGGSPAELRRTTRGFSSVYVKMMNEKQTLFGNSGRRTAIPFAPPAILPSTSLCINTPTNQPVIYMFVCVSVFGGA